MSIGPVDSKYYVEWHLSSVIRVCFDVHLLLGVLIDQGSVARGYFGSVWYSESASLPSTQGMHLIHVLYIIVTCYTVVFTLSYREVVSTKDPIGAIDYPGRQIVRGVFSKFVTFYSNITEKMLP